MSAVAANPPAQHFAPPNSVENLAELVARLGDIPLARIRLHPPIGMATEADVISAMEAPRKRLCELIDGVLVEKAMGYTEAVLALYLGRLLDEFVRPRNSGLVTAPDGTVRLWAGRVRIPDLAFTSWDRMPGRKRPRAPIPELAPNLAVEILSESNTRKEMAEKRKDYFTAGVELVWEIDPANRTVDVYTSLATKTTLSEADHLDGGTVLPGFNLALRTFFAELDREG